jgi:ribosomal protein S18 acetylase RimI-like enzyme
MTVARIRRAVPEDVPAILRIAERGWNATYGEFLAQDTIDAAMSEWYTPEATCELIEREDAAYFVAERRGNVLGYVCGGPSGEEPVATLGAIYVHPDCWGDGIGTALLDEFEAFCRQRGYEAIRIEVLAENDVGLSFYREHGYEVVDRRGADLFGEAVRKCELRGRIE